MGDTLSALLASVLLVLVAAGMASGSMRAGERDQYGPGPVLRRWPIGSVSERCGFEALVLVERLNGSGLIEVALAGGPDRIGLAIVYSGTSEAYLMAGDQNSWRALGTVEPGTHIWVSAEYRVGGEAHVEVRLGNRTINASYSYGGETPTELRLALSPVKGGAVIRLERMLVWRDWLTVTLAPSGAAGTCTSSTGSSATSTSSSASPSPGPTSPVNTIKPLGTATPLSGTASWAGRSWDKSIAVVAAALVIGVLAVLLRRSSPGSVPGG